LIVVGTPLCYNDLTKKNSTNKSEYQVQYDREHKRFFGLNLMRTTDSDIIDYLEKQPNKQAIIKDALREKMAREKVRT
jgi:hypothetical protein